MDDLRNSGLALPFDGSSAVTCRAIYLAARIDTRKLQVSGALGQGPLLVQEGVAGAAAIFRYGVVVLFNMSALEQATFLESIRLFCHEPMDAPEEEEATLVVGEDLRIHGGHIEMPLLTAGRLQLIADVLAKTVVLAQFERAVASEFDQVEPLAATLKKDAKVRRATKELIRQIGGALLVLTKTLGRVEVTEKPELLWEHAELEPLFARLEDEYEIRERHHALERKLDLVARTAETLLQLVQHQSSHRVEWYITLLIVFEIVLSLVEKLF